MKVGHYGLCCTPTRRHFYDIAVVHITVASDAVNITRMCPVPLQLIPLLELSMTADGVVLPICWTCSEAKRVQKHQARVNGSVGVESIRASRDEYE